MAMSAAGQAAGRTAGQLAAKATGKAAAFGPQNPFYAASTLPFHAPPFDRIKDADYQPALEAGMVEQMKEVEAIANNPAAPTFENTLVALEESGQLYNRVQAVFDAVTMANSDPTLEKVDRIEAPRRAAHSDAIFLNEKLFARVAAIHKEIHQAAGKQPDAKQSGAKLIGAKQVSAKKASAKQTSTERAGALILDPESRRLVDVYYRLFLHQGASLPEADKAKLRKLNEEESTLQNSFRTKLLAATRDAAYSTTDKAALHGLTDAQLKAAAAAARERKVAGYILPLQNTTQQPVLASLEDRATRQAIFEDSWNRAERGGANDTRQTIARLAQLRAQKAKLLGTPNYAAWVLEDQMAKTPTAAVKFMDALVPAATAGARAEGNDIQALIDKQGGGFALQPWDWEFYSEQVRRAKYDIDPAQVRPYFELNNVLENGVFYAANKLYGITFKERKDIPVYAPGVRVFEVFNANRKPLALFYCDYFKRDNKSGGAWMSNFVGQSKLLGTLPVIYNVANFAPPAAGTPALIDYDEVTTMFHEFGHALQGMFSDVEYPLLSGTAVPRDFVEFPSQFNEHWASDPAVFSHYARNYKTGAPMPAELAQKLRDAENFNQGYQLTELLAAAELDMQWHTLPADAPLEDPDAFEKAALKRKHVLLAAVPPRYRSSYFAHIWSTGYAAGYYAYLWSEMLDDNAYLWFQEHGGMTRANGQRLRQMVLSKGYTEDPAKMYAAWLGAEPSAEPMLRDRRLAPDGAAK